MPDSRIFEVYKLLDEKVAHLRDHRLGYTRTFVLFNSVLPGALLFALLGREDLDILYSMDTTVVLILAGGSAIGVVVNYIWYKHIRYIQDWNFVNYAQLFLLEDEIGISEPHHRPYHMFVNIYFPNAIHPIVEGMISYRDHLTRPDSPYREFSNVSSINVEGKLEEGLKKLKEARKAAPKSQRQLSFTNIELGLPLGMMLVWLLLLIGIVVVQMFPEFPKGLAG